MVFHNDEIIKSKGKPGLCFLPISWWSSSLLFISYNLTNRWLLTYNRTEFDFILIPENERFHILIKESFQWSLQISWPRVALSGEVRGQDQRPFMLCLISSWCTRLCFVTTAASPCFLIRRANWTCDFFFICLRIFLLTRSGSTDDCVMVDETLSLLRVRPCACSTCALVWSILVLFLNGRNVRLLLLISWSSSSEPGCLSVAGRSWSGPSRCWSEVDMSWSPESCDLCKSCVTSVNTSLSASSSLEWSSTSSESASLLLWVWALSWWLEAAPSSSSSPAFSSSASSSGPPSSSNSASSYKGTPNMVTMVTRSY